MNSISPIVAKLLRAIEIKLSPYFRQRPVIRRRLEQQLEFPWLSKR
ncbi:MAG: hypothetical protein RLZZ214_1670 [Verrucomicrobiota bacterium]|jgi:hypothetical protein